MRHPFLALLLFAALPAHANVHLLGSPQIRRELGIPHPLALRIVQNLNEAARLNRGGIMTFQEAKTLAAERARTSPEQIQSHIMTWLSPAQKQRLEQIELQQGGPFIFQDWRFAQRVGLSRQQHQKLQATFIKAFQSYLKKMQALSKANANWFGTLDHKQYASKYAAYYRQTTRLANQRRAAAEAALSRSLTQVQKAKWQSILGKPFRARLTYDTKSYPMD